MAIYLANIILMCVVALFTLTGAKKKKGIFIACASTQWILLSGLRHLSIGADTKHYEWYFNTHNQHTWGEIGNMLLTESFKPGKEGGIEVMYIAAEKLVYGFGGSYRAFLFVIAIAFTVTMGIFIYKYSADAFISFILYSCLFYSFFAITGHRQTLSTVFTVFIGYMFAERRDFLGFLLVMLMGFLFHRTALIFLPCYFVFQIKYSKKLNLILFSLIPVAFLVSRGIFELLVSVSQYAGYGEYDGRPPITFTVLLIGILITAAWRWPFMPNPEETSPVFYLVFITAFLMPLVYINPSMMRLVQYYSLFLLLLIPQIVYSFHGTNRKIVYSLAVIGLVFMLVKNNPVYLFA